MFRKKVPVICFRNIILNNSLGCTNSVNLAFARFKQDANLPLLENLIEVFLLVLVVICMILECREYPRSSSSSSSSSCPRATNKDVKRYWPFLF